MNSTTSFGRQFAFVSVLFVTVILVGGCSTSSQTKTPQEKTYSFSMENGRIVFPPTDSSGKSVEDASMTMRILPIPYTPAAASENSASVDAEGSIEMVSCMSQGQPQFVPLLKTLKGAYVLQLNKTTSYEVPDGDRPNPNAIIWRPKYKYSVTGRPSGVLIAVSQEKFTVLNVSRISRQQ